MKNQVKALKVKIKSLAAEARIIRLEERRALGRRKPDGELYFQLRTHRIQGVRREARLSLLAYGFIRGRPYAACEKAANDNPPDMVRVKQLVEKFGGVPGRPRPVTNEELTAWRSAVPTPTQPA